MKNANDVTLCVCVVVLALLLLCSRACAGKYEYKGVYPVEGVLVNLCENCYMNLPPEYMQSNITLAVNTDNIKDVERALVSASAAVGWSLQRTRRGWRAEPLQNEGNAVFISCMTYEPVNVPKYLYGYAVRSDSIKCAKRDSVAAVSDSVENVRRDSVQRVRDSIAALPPLEWRHYELRYYSYSQTFADRMGVEWPTTWALGNLHDKLQVFDEWSAVATSTRDTAFTNRRLLFSLDSSLSVDWGSEEQTLKQTFVNDGVTTQDYEWRKYGLIVQIVRDGKRTRMQYTFRDKSSGVSLLQGSAVGAEGDTIRMQGTYTAMRETSRGVPFLSALPVVGYLFSVKENSTEQRAFELYLVPVTDEQKRGQMSREPSRNPPWPTWTTYGEDTQKERRTAKPVPNNLRRNSGE